MNHTKELLSIELSNLVRSPFNARRYPMSQVEELAALIAAQGLLHNVVVAEQGVGRGRDRKIKFAVVAGDVLLVVTAARLTGMCWLLVSLRCKAPG